MSVITELHALKLVVSFLKTDLTEFGESHVVPYSHEVLVGKGHEFVLVRVALEVDDEDLFWDFDFIDFEGLVVDFVEIGTVNIVLVLG